MQYSFALLALAASAYAGAITAQVSPTGAAPPTCSSTYDGQFEITVVKPVAAKRSVEKVRLTCICR